MPADSKKPTRGILRRLNTLWMVLRKQGLDEALRLTVQRVKRAGEPPPPPGPPPHEAPHDYLGLDPGKPARLLEARPVADSLTLNWIVPPFGIGSGGHMTIFRIIRLLEELGHRSTIHLYHPSDWALTTTSDQQRKLIKEHFQPLEATVKLGVGDLTEADVLIATSWETAWVVHQLGQARARCYFVQDFEPFFYPVGTMSTLANNSYSFGFHALTAGPWLAKKYREEYGGRATHFDLATDHDVYKPSAAPRQTSTIAFYARWMTERRGYDLAISALEILASRVPELNVIFFGADSLPAKPTIRHTHARILTPLQLAELYHRSTAGLVLSLTNPSLIPTEMMACGLPVVDVDTPATRAFFDTPGGRPLSLAAPFPSLIAAALEELLLNAALRTELSDRGSRYAESLTWEHSAKQVEAGLREALTKSS